MLHRGRWGFKQALLCYTDAGRLPYFMLRGKFLFPKNGTREGTLSRNGRELEKSQHSSRWLHSQSRRSLTVPRVCIRTDSAVSSTGPSDEPLNKVPSAKSLGEVKDPVAFPQQ